MERTWKPIVAGIALILIGVVTLVARILLHFDVDWSTDVYLGSALAFGILTIASGCCSLWRKVWGLALAGPFFALFSWIEGMITAISWEYALAGTISMILFFVDTPLAIFAIVLLARSKNEFTRKSAESSS